MILFIYFCILVLNAITIFLTYKFLGNEMNKKEKTVFVAAGIAVIYILVSGVYWLSTKDIASTQSVSKNLITFSFVPVNGLLILPFLAKSYTYWKKGVLKTEKFRNRGILMAIILVVLLILEFFYFKEIELGILNMVNSISK